MPALGAGGEGGCLFTAGPCRQLAGPGSGGRGRRGGLEEGEKSRDEYKRILATQPLLPEASKTLPKSLQFYTQVLIFQGTLSNRP